jgi:hypothetical protein
VPVIKDPRPATPSSVDPCLDFAYDGGGLGAGATATLSGNGTNVAYGGIASTVALIFSGDEGADVGVDEATNVSDAYKEDDNRVHR